MYELYIGNKNYSSWSLRPWVLLRARGIPFVEHIKPFARGSNFAAFRAFSPSGKVPCLRDGATVVWDSLGISEYLAERHPGLWPADAAARTWARCAAAEMHSGFATLRTICTMNVGLRVQLHTQPAGTRRGHPPHRRALERRPVALRRTVSRRHGIHRGRRVLLPGCLSRAHLWR